MYVADTSNSTIRKITAAGVVSTMAGSAGQTGSIDASGSAARFAYPRGVAVDGSGNVYVADSNNSTIRKITPAGVVSTLAGSAGQAGSADGTGSAARFEGPNGVAVDGSGNVYVADTYNKTIRKITPAGVVSTVAGSARQPGSTDGTGPAARFFDPSGITVDGSGNLYVADTRNSTIRKITPAGMVSTVAGSAVEMGTTDGTLLAARFVYPLGVAVDESGNVYVADSPNSFPTYGGTIRKITPAGMVSTLAGSAAQPSGSADGTGPAARFAQPYGVAADKAGNVYVADLGNDTIRKITTTAGVASTVAGSAGQSGSVDGTGAAARFSNPSGVAVDGSGNVYVADQMNSTIRKITPAGAVSTLAGSAGQIGATDGTGSAARFFYPSGVAVDGSGNVYVADQMNSTIRKITPAGAVSTLAGSAAQPPGSADGTGSAARFYWPNGVAVDGSGNVYVADTYNHTIRKITPAGMVSTLAGSAGQFGSTDGTGPAARLFYPFGVAVDGFGNACVADTPNGTIRKITPAGVVSTLAGLAGQNGTTDGTGSVARFFYPSGVAVDGSGNVYVADTLNSTIRRITSAGVVTTWAGTPGQSGTVPGSLPATLFQPSAVAFDQGRGNVFIVVRDAVLEVAGPPDVCHRDCLHKHYGEFDGCGGICTWDCGGRFCPPAPYCKLDCVGRCVGEYGTCGSVCALVDGADSCWCRAGCTGKCFGDSDGCGFVCFGNDGSHRCCTPDCGGKCVGADDGCGSACTASDGTVCSCTPSCTGKCAGDDDGCGFACQANDAAYCCQPACTGMPHGGSNGCGAVCN